MFVVVDHHTGQAASYETLAEALAAGRHQAHQRLAGSQVAVVEERCEDGLLLFGETKGDHGATLELDPLVWVSFLPAELEAALGNQ